MRFLRLLLLIPVIEMLLLIKVGEWLGAFYTVGLVILSALLGLSLLRRQGVSTLMRASRKIEQGGLPAQEMAEGFLLAASGILFLAPGFFTDAIAFCCLVPFSRRFLARQLLGRGFFMAPGVMGAHSSSAFYSRSRVDDVIEGEFSRNDQGRLK